MARKPAPTPDPELLAAAQAATQAEAAPDITQDETPAEEVSTDADITARLAEALATIDRERAEHSAELERLANTRDAQFKALTDEHDARMDVVKARVRVLADDLEREQKAHAATQEMLAEAHAKLAEAIAHGEVLSSLAQPRALPPGEKVCVATKRILHGIGGGKSITYMPGQTIPDAVRDQMPPDHYKWVDASTLALLQE